MNKFFSLGRNLDSYKQLLSEIASLSSLFSDSEVPALNYRAVEAAYVWATGSKDLSRRDTAFDAIHPKGFGVGIKTFTVEPGDKYSDEKIAEFNTLSRRGAFINLKGKELAKEVATARNQRIDQAYKIDFMGGPDEIPLTNSAPIYHCVIRTRGRYFIQEFDYPRIDVKNIVITSKPGKLLKFTDGHHMYKWNPTKSTLYMRFQLGDPKNDLKQRVTIASREILIEHMLNPPGLGIPKSSSMKHAIEKTPGLDYWVLPLFTPSMDGFAPRVARASGINLCFASQKNRKRKMGECEIPILKDLREKYPNFLPYSGDGKTGSKIFTLPNGDHVKGKPTGKAGKNLTFADGNKTGGHNQKVFTNWIFFEIDRGSISRVQRRWQRREPYTYTDLLRAGVDSLVIEKEGDDLYRLTLGKPGSFEAFAEVVGIE